MCVTVRGTPPLRIALLSCSLLVGLYHHLSEATLTQLINRRMPPKRKSKREEDESEEEEPEIEDDDDEDDDGDVSPSPAPVLSRSNSNRPKRQAQEKVAVAYEEEVCDLPSLDQ